MNYEATQLALADILSDRDTRNAVEDALSDSDPCEAARLIVNALHRTSTAPQRPAPTIPQSEGGTAAGVPIETLAMLAGQTP
jgi:hypothetical protein